MVLTPSVGFRDFIKKGCPKFPPEKNRYHLYVSYVCPFAHRAIIVRKLKGLEKVISMSVVHPIKQKTRQNEDHYGWTFGKGPYTNENGKFTKKIENADEDPYLKVKFIRDIYDKAKNSVPNVERYTIPILYDTKNNLIVNNESADIIKMFNSEFNEFAEFPELNLAPEIMNQQSSQLLEQKVSDHVSDGVYKCAFSPDQKIYEMNFKALFQVLDECEQILSKSKFLLGNQLTLVDIKLFTTMLRFDEIYYVLFKTNKKLIAQYPNLLRLTKEIYNLKDISKTTDFEHIQLGYFTGFLGHNPNCIIPLGSNFFENLKN